ncbi:MAG: putative peptidoglycan binding domain-containing protein [Sulfolobaceae archaeon]
MDSVCITFFVRNTAALNEINEALKRLGYTDLKSWIELNNFELKESALVIR